MSTAKTLILNLAQLRDAVEANDSLPVQTRREVCSAIKRFCEICGFEPVQIAADPAAIRCLRGNASWQIAGISEQAWRNILSRLTRAMEMADIDVARRCRISPLIPEWRSLLAQLPNQNAVHGLRRFAGWCSSQGIKPEAVTEERYAAFFVFLQTQSVQRNEREKWQVARRSWNKFVALPGSGFGEIENTTPAQWVSRPLTEFPLSLQQEIADWKKWMTDPGLETDRDPFRLRTVKGYEGAIRRYLSKLVEDGFSVEDFESLSTLLEVSRIKRGIDRIRAGRSDDGMKPSIHAMVKALLCVLRYLEVTPEHPRFASQQQALAILRKVASKVRNRQHTMTKKNKDRLATLESPAAARMFRTLHLRVAQRYAKIAKPTVAEALDMQSATLHMLLLYAPLRISNLSILDNRHIVRPAGGKAGPWRIHFDGSEMKNAQPYDGALIEEASQYLADYLARFQPIISEGRGTAIFLSSRTGMPKSVKCLSKQYSGFIFRELGLRVNPHLMRHYAGFQWLENRPGEYEALSKLLSHSSSQTTVSFYTGAETKTAQTRWQGLLGDMIAQDKAFEATRKSRKRHQVAPGDLL